MNKSIFGIILIITAFVSVIQLDLLTKGLAEKTAEVMALTKPVTTPVPVYKPEEFRPRQIEIPNLNLKLEVVSVFPKNGTWEVIPGVANFAEGTSLINAKEGNVGIYAHDRVDGFSQIKDLKVGDTILIKDLDKQATYVVKTASKIAPDQVDVFYPTEKPELTLLTCDGLFSEKRYVVKAELVDIKN